MEMSNSNNSRKTLSKAFYLISFIAASGLLLALSIMQKTDGAGIVNIFLPALYLIIVLCIFLYKVWSAIQDGKARTTPGKAVGFLFIPIYNIYWMFQAILGFAKDYNAYIERHGIKAPKLSEGLFLALCIFNLVEGAAQSMPVAIGISVLIVSFILGLMTINSACNAVNRLP